jgi:hypothetical protein
MPNRSTAWELDEKASRQKPGSYGPLAADMRVAFRISGHPYAGERLVWEPLALPELRADLVASST